MKTDPAQTSFNFFKWWIAFTLVVASVLAMAKWPAPVVLVLSLCGGLVYTLVAYQFHQGSDEGRSTNNAKKQAVKIFGIASLCLTAGCPIQTLSDTRWAEKVGGFIGGVGVFAGAHGFGVIWGAWRQRKARIAHIPGANPGQR